LYLAFFSIGVAAVPTKYTPWSESDVQRLRSLVASGASAARASVALKGTPEDISELDE
jgi:hypothetical protein